MPASERSATREPIDSVVDWEFAVRTAATIGRSGPDVSAAEAAQVVGELREAAAASGPHVSSVTHLPVPAAGEVLVVDRPGWTKINARSFRTLLAPAVAESFARRERPVPSGAFSSVGARVTGAEVGALLGVLSSRVLGQYDAFGEVSGRLILVAPTIVAVERDLGVDPHDFRLWVCLHEETHRLQFTANPWLADHLATQVRSMVGTVLGEPSEVAERFGILLRQLPDVVRGRDDAGGGSLLDLVQTPEQRRKLAEVTAVMSLLEGHADVVMDDVGPQVVPSVAQIRARFTQRRKGRGLFDQVLRRLLGLDAKARQYADGARFVRGVIDRVGMDGFNAVWTSPATLPSPEEIADPVAWVRRVAS